MTMIRFTNVSKHYPNGHQALSRINFHLANGEMAFLTGHSGAGKSTLLKLIMRIEKPSEGKITLAGHPIPKLSRRRIPKLRRGIGMIFQNPRLLQDRSVFDNIALPLQISGFRSRDIGRRVRAALDKVGLLNKEKLHPLDLSHGEQQRIGIARAIVNKPPLVLADEPTGNLDPELSLEIMRVFEELNQVGVTVLVATHDLTMIAGLKHRIMTLKQGRLISGVSV